MTIINESLDYLDMEDQLGDVLSVDEYAAKMGSDKDIVTLSFLVKSKLAAKDLVTWFERGYDWVLDASISDGELEPGKWLVFVEMDRRSKVPNRIITLLSDLETLTGMKLKDWTVEIEGDEYDADEEIIRQKMILNPNEYEELKKIEEVEKEGELNEMRKRAGLETKLFYNEDEYIKNLKTMAGM
jgi:hypothetical protein